MVTPKPQNHKASTDTPVGNGPPSPINLQIHPDGAVPARSSSIRFGTNKKNEFDIHRPPDPLTGVS